MKGEGKWAKLAAISIIRQPALLRQWQYTSSLITSCKQKQSLMWGNMLSLHALSITRDMALPSHTTPLWGSLTRNSPLCQDERVSSTGPALKHFLIPDHNSLSQELPICSQMQELGDATTQDLMPVQVFG